jgi:hypothetical protein
VIAILKDIATDIDGIVTEAVSAMVMLGHKAVTGHYL